MCTKVIMIYSFRVLVAIGFAIQNVTASSITSSFYSTDGPWLPAYSYSWSQYITPTTVGTVMVTVNEATNQTFSTTIYLSEYESDGTMELLTRTNTDSAGTVTEIVKDFYDAQVTITYPTNYFEPSDSMVWSAILPVTAPGTYYGAEEYASGLVVSTLGLGGTCCIPTYTLSPTPSHTPFPQTGTANSEDPRGWLYTLVGVDASDPWENLYPSDLSSLWAPQPLEFTYAGCPYTMCTVSKYQPPAAAVAVNSQAFLLATSTTTISSATSTSASPAAKVSSEKQPSTSREVATSTSPAGKVSPKQQPSISSIAAKSISSAAAIAPHQNPSTSSVVSTSDSPVAKESPKQQPSTSNAVSINTSPTAEVKPAKDTSMTESLSIKSTTSIPPQMPKVQSSTAESRSSNDESAPETSDTPSPAKISQNTALQNSLTQNTAVQTSLQYSTLSLPAVTVGSAVFSANSESEYIIDGQTLLPGTEIVVSGTTITDIGGYIWLGLGGSAPTSAPDGSGSSASTPTTSITDLPSPSSASSSPPTFSSDSELVTVSFEIIGIMLGLLHIAVL